MKNTSRKPLTKCIACILVVVLLTAIALQLAYIKYANLNMESIVEKEYKNSKTFGYEVNKAINDTYKLLQSKEDERIQNINYFYLIKNDNKVYTNAYKYNKNFYEGYKDSFFAYEKGKYIVGETTNSSLIKSFPGNKDYTMYISFNNSFMLEGQNGWDSGRERLIPLIFLISICLILVLLLLSYLILVTGRRVETEELYISGIEKIYTELLLLGSIPIVAMFLYLHKILYYVENTGHKLSYEHIFTMYLIGVATIAMASLFLISLLSIARKIKAKRFFKGSITYIILKKLAPYINDLFNKNRFKDNSLTKTLYKRQKIFIIISVILVFLAFLFISQPFFIIIPIILEIGLIYWYVKYNNEIFHEINTGFNESLKEQMKSERMKVNLITNVSHDLKTPLTSIISYIDLLSREELSETSRDYVNILIKKSHRLKNIVLDLFDLAKSTSGDIKLELETLDLKKLIEQTLGDMEDDIKKSGFQIKIIFPENPINIVSDGNRLYRVFQNIIDNSLKYSLEGTRIFIELEEYEENVLISIKNISKSEINFTASEILQRFNRGDKNRTTEGSGLGLSIAESFTKVCGGEFKIEIDGDMFKVIISFKTV